MKLLARAPKFWVLIAGSLLLSQLAYAAVPHPFLRRSRPAEAEVVTGSPKELRLTFSEPIELRFARLELLGPGDRPVALGQLSIVPDSLGTVVATIQQPLTPGAYKVAWQAAGSDAHVVRGEYAFSVGEATGAGGETPVDEISTPHTMLPPTSSAASSFDASHPLFVGTRWLMYLALMGVIGSVVFQRSVLGRVTTRCQVRGEVLDPMLTVVAARIGRVGSYVLLAALPLRLVAQLISMHTPREAFDASMISSVLLHTVWGWTWIAQLGLGMAAIAAFETARSSGRWKWAGMIAVLLAVTPAFAGHAIGAERFTALAVLADGLHVFGAAAWLGTLGVVLAAGVLTATKRSDHGALAKDLVTSFSPVALAAVSVVIVSGTTSAWIHLGRLADLWNTTYGQVLLLKIGVLAIVGGTGAYNWRLVLPRMGDDVAAARVLRSASLEVLVAVLVLFVTAVLVALPTPMGAHGP